MRPGSFVFLLLVFSVASGCGPSMKRIGYEKPAAEPREECSVTFLEVEKDQAVPGKLLGTVKIGGSRFGFIVDDFRDCSEKTARRIIREEACLLGADIVALRGIKKFGLGSNCYQATADFIKSSDSLTINDYLAMKQSKSARSLSIAFYGTLGYSGAAMKKLNNSIEYQEAGLRSAGVPVDLETFAPGGIEYGFGFSAKIRPTISAGVDISYQSMSVENRYADSNLDLSNKIDANVIDFQGHAEYRLPRLSGVNVGVTLSGLLGKYHEVSSSAQQDPPTLSYSDVSFWGSGLGFGTFVGYEVPVRSRTLILVRAGYRMRILDQFGAGVLDARGRELETDFSGFYIIAGLGRTMSDQSRR
jgi:hypothetical protein